MVVLAPTKQGLGMLHPATWGAEPPPLETCDNCGHALKEEDMNFYAMTAEHWIFIPSLFALGWVVGFLMGASKARE